MIEYLKMYIISDKVMNFFMNLIKKLESGIDSGRTNSCKVNNTNKYFPKRLTFAPVIC